MGDVRALGDLTQQLQQTVMTAVARAARTIPAPDPQVVGPEVAGAAPVEVPAVTVLRPDLSTLPAELVGPDGQPAIPAIVAWLWAAVAQRDAAQVRVATGRTVLNSGPVHPAGSSWDVAVLFDEPAPIAPAGGWVQQTSAIALLGQTSARVKPGTITKTGCTVEVKSLGPGPVVLTAGTQLVVEVVALYWWVPPFVAP